MLLTAPTEITESASAGAIARPFPTAVTQTKPKLTAISTAIVVVAVLPLKSVSEYQSAYPSELEAISAPLISPHSKPAT